MNKWVFIKAITTKYIDYKFAFETHRNQYKEKHFCIFTVH